MKNSFAKPCAIAVAVAAMSLPSLTPASAMSRPRGVPETEQKKADEPAPPVGENSGAPAEKKEPAPAAQNAQVTVLGYHRFVKKVRHPDTEITPEDFEAQMKALKDQGITVISLPDFLAWKEGKKAIPPHSALITFDDGWRSQYELAWPILKKYGYPFTMFIYTDYVKGGKRTGGESMSWQELEQMRDAGVDIQSHTISHADLRGKKGMRDTPEYDKWLWNELAGSKEMIEQKLGVKVNALALPYGFYNAKVQEMAKKAGYDAIFTVYGQKITMSTPLNNVGRTIMESNKPKLFATATHFTNSGDEGGGVAIAEVSPETLALTPADGSRTSEAQPEISANLKSFGGVKPESVQLRISGIGLVKGAYDPKTQTVTWRPEKKLQDDTYTVIVSAENPQGRKQEARWKFSVSNPQAEQSSGEGQTAKASPGEADAAGSGAKTPEAVGEKTGQEQEAQPSESPASPGAQ